MTEEKLAIMKEVGFGCRDIGKPCLFFTVYITECSAALQVLGSDEALKVIADSGVYDVKRLEGKPCWVTVENNTIKFIRVWKE